MKTEPRNKKLKSIKNGDRVAIRGEVFQVSSVRPQADSQNIQLELQGNDGGSVTVIGVPGARVSLAATP
ncbi:hypothetical protein [Arthrobacter sp. fls2-241-R2A-200]|uniref:hypothetical protein n=1 Tax=Arthrobacter sp. fls2-241-R2A-200 TaxID=3040281 RepID=UPI0025504F3E|nr:hypothetical protein [Arthrobacter sp. fls2-241-R2A-200]